MVAIAHPLRTHVWLFWLWVTQGYALDLLLLVLLESFYPQQVRTIIRQAAEYTVRPLHCDTTKVARSQQNTDVWAMLRHGRGEEAEAETKAESSRPTKALLRAMVAVVIYR
jgi:hypothetical protein